jgi:hypothetical protein
MSNLPLQRKSTIAPADEVGIRSHTRVWRQNVGWLGATSPTMLRGLGAIR